ncbi:hypothetical protein IQ37_09790 [Chryseobacterium piperi]|uniref:Uncharacterized protein n=1 Tax=Chryseobacterium piperi TaxID=558152 RepID=A0A086BIA4_9FLAO|nr:hypothetical protein [Chryseobacterium piperi]ASW72981.1 hypothetical protein CJF12_00875 [Chryseobacterium piperi]KFF28668.1 hypothetical protein IQ37_09790 [Chryseobacterium piperi]
MITENVINLFSFIDFLHSNTAYLLSKQGLIDETNGLLEKRSSIRPSENYKSKIEYDKLQIQIAEQFDIVDAEIIFPLKEKIKELNIADISTPIINLTAQPDLFELQRNFNEDDLHSIFEAKQKYLNFRNETNFDFYLQFFFFELDRTLNEFYEFFKDGDFNEFSKLQTNVVTVESLDKQGIEKAVRKLTGNSNNLHFETFPEFLNYLKKETETFELETEPFRILNLQQIKLENATIQSEIDEVLVFSENAVKELKQKLILSFSNENYKTQYNAGLNPRLLEIVKIFSGYEMLYTDAKNRNKKIIDIENYNKFLESEKYEQSKRVFIKANKEDAQRLGIREGESYSIFPQPKNKEEAIERFKKHRSKRVFESMKQIFINKYSDKPSAKIIQDELNRIYTFIGEANKQSTEIAFNNKDNSEYLEYLRLANNFYENPKLPFYDYEYYFNGNSASIYAKYFLYKKWLEEKREIYYYEKAPKFIAKEYALAYIFDLYANGKKLPVNRIDGGYNQKEIEDIGIAKGLKGILL